MIDLRFSLSFSLECLIPKTRKIALLSNEESIADFNDDIWIGYLKVQEAIFKFQKLIDHSKKQRILNLLIVDSTYYGKSMIVEKFKRKHKFISNENASKEITPIVSLQIKIDLIMAIFYVMLLYNLEALVTMKYKLAVLENVALKLFKQLSNRMIIIVEHYNIPVGRIKLNNVEKSSLNYRNKNEIYKNKVKFEELLNI
jgi:hypothetical protein